MTEFICKYCGKVCKNANSLRNHERLCKENPNRQISPFIEYNKKHSTGEIPIWNKGLTKETDERVKKCGETYKKHIEEGKIIPSFYGKNLSEEHKKAISESMKKAHAENRAHNIGECRWNNEHSWPEKWFIQVLLNEFKMYENVDYMTELPFYKYSLDFAWPDKKFVIEIDGEQHEKYEDYKQRDIQKDTLLEENNWQIIRIPWKDCYKRPKYYIEMVFNKFKELQII